MNNDNIKLIKFVELQHYDLNLDKTKVYVDTTTSKISVDLYLNRRITACPFCGPVLLLLIKL